MQSVVRALIQLHDLKKKERNKKLKKVHAENKPKYNVTLFKAEIWPQPQKQKKKILI